MKVVFIEEVQNVAKAGDVKEVSDGYARNYLLPKKLALINKPGAANSVKAIIEAKAEVEQAKKLAALIEGKEITLKVKMGAKDRMHGSVTTANIADELKAIIDQDIDKRKIELPEPIKTLGSYDIAIKLYKSIEPKIKLNIVEKDKEPGKEAAAEPEKKSE
jgi:large subunit ribosomal protein L9